MRRLKVSVLTLVRNRETHLNNLIEGLCHTIQLPDELVIVRMNESPKPFLDLPFDCRQITLSTNVALPLAKARNRAAQAAKGDFLIFLDVDCIPGQSCINEYLKAHALKPQAVLMGAVYYLHRPLPPKWIMGQLRKQSSPHPARHPKDQTFLQTETNYNLFWTLSFGISRQQFAIIGGFCESYRGYGAEDTDFARMM
ncbi:MAG: glycosyltransferase family 2 protein [Microcoleaceae cyanobacterium]